MSRLLLLHPRTPYLQRNQNNMNHTIDPAMGRLKKLAAAGDVAKLTELDDYWHSVAQEHKQNAAKSKNGVEKAELLRQAEQARIISSKAQALSKIIADTLIDIL